MNLNLQDRVTAVARQLNATLKEHAQGVVIASVPYVLVECAPVGTSSRYNLNGQQRCCAYRCAEVENWLSSDSDDPTLESLSAHAEAENTHALGVALAAMGWRLMEYVYDGAEPVLDDAEYARFCGTSYRVTLDIRGLSPSAWELWADHRVSDTDITPRGDADDCSETWHVRAPDAHTARARAEAAIGDFDARVASVEQIRG